MYLYHHPARHNLPNSYVIIFWGIFLFFYCWVNYYFKHPASSCL